MPRKNSAKSGLLPFKSIELNGAAPVAPSARPWLSITIDPETRLAVEVQTANGKALLFPQKGLWKQSRAWAWPVAFRPMLAKPLETAANPSRRGAKKPQRMRGYPKGAEVGR